MRPPTRELEILLAVAHGESLRCIADRLIVAESSVRESLVRTRERYGAPNNEAAIATALDREDLEVPPPRFQIKLTSAQQDLLERIALGQGDNTLTAELFVSRSTIDGRVSELLDRLGARNRCHAVYVGFRHGYLYGYRQLSTRRARESELRALSTAARSADIDEAAKTLELEPSTVKAYLRRSRRRFGASTTPQAVAVAIRRGEIECPRVRRTTARLLDDRELNAMKWIALGMNGAQVATRMGLSVRTTDRIVGEALTKLRAKSRSHAVYLLFQQGVLS
jgi:DNA-binding NarL/FixJ family response regulator